MVNKILNGFPLRRCSWLYAPVAPAPMTRMMIRWLDSVCTSRAGQKRGGDGMKVLAAAKGFLNET
jgi:hypothetical protein